MLVMMLRTVTVPAPCRLVLVAHDRVRRRSLRRQMLVEPRQRGGDPGILVAQPVHQLDGECVRQRRAFALREHTRRRFGGAAASTQQAVGETIRLLPRGTAVHDQFGDASEVFDQHDPERDRDRPEFADRQRLHFLIGAHEAAQHIGIEVAVGVGDEGPGEAEHPRISGERAVGQLRQLPIIAGRQSGADFANLPFDEIIVVDQPFSRRRDGAALIDRSGDQRGRRRAERRRCRRAGRPVDGPWIGFGVTGCAAARLRACSSRRSTLNSSARTGSWLSQGDARPARPNARERRVLNWTSTFGRAKLDPWRARRISAA